jgi:hypothetical protein
MQILKFEKRRQDKHVLIDMTIRLENAGIKQNVAARGRIPKRPSNAILGCVAWCM